MPRARDHLWDALEAELGTVATASERGRRNKALKELREIAATPEDVRRRCHTYRRMYPTCTLTATALVANWSQLKPRDRTPTPSVDAVVDLPPADAEANLARIRQLQAHIGREV